MSLPRVSHLQFLVLGVLRDGVQLGSEIRNELADHGVHKSGPAFYQLMARLEDARLVTGRYDTRVVEGQQIRQRAYRITAHGQAAWSDSREFYLAAICRFGPEGLADA